MFRRICTRSFALTLVVLVTAIFAFGQNLDDVTITGKVLDPNGLAIVGATVVATNTENGTSRTVTTDDEGRYNLVKLTPGNYKVKVTASGFGAQETPSIATISAQNVQRDFKLSPAGVTAEQTITVTEDDSPLVDTTRTVVGGTVSQREIEELPIDTRNPLDLVLTLGGTAEEQLSTRDLSSDRGARGLTAPGTTPEEAGIFGLSGGAAYSNNITIDGLDNNDDRGASFRFQPSIDAISEVQVITNQFSAEYGRASGGRVNLTTRGGSNKFRGRAYFYFRDESLNANTWNNNRRGFAKPPLQERNPGFTFGGPIIKDKLFFFSSYEYNNLFDTTILDAWTPAAGANSVFPLPTPNNPTLGTVIVPAATCPTGFTCPAVTVGNYTLATDTPAIVHTATSRVDWNAGKYQNMTFSWQLGRSNDLRSFSGTNRIADSIIGRVRNTDGFNFTHNLFDGNKVNQVRIQYSKLDPSSSQAAGALSPAVLVTFTQQGTQVFGSTTSSSDRKENRIQIQDTFSLVKGNTTWRMGYDFQNVDTTFIDRFDITGTYTFGSFSNFVGGVPTRLQQNFGGNSELNNKYFGAFVQNDWRAKSNLTLNFGLRYERETVLDDNNNWGPRVAAAWDPFKKGKGVIRFGVGIFYNRVLLRTIDDYTGDLTSLRLDTNSVPLPAGSSFSTDALRRSLAGLFPNPVTLDTRLAVTTTPGQTFTVRELSRSSTVFRNLSPDIVIPKSYQVNGGFEREVGKGMVFEANVTFNRTVNLWRETNPNAPILPTGVTDTSGDGRVTYTDYLLGLSSGTNRFFSGTVGEVGGTHDGSPTAAAACTTATTLCYVNVNTSSTSFPSGGCATAAPNTAYCRAIAALNPLRPAALFAQFGQEQLETVTSIGNSRYIGAVFELRNRYVRFKNGFGGSWRLSYTLSRLMDDGIVNTSDPTTPGDFRGDWSRSLADRTHRISLTATMDTPNWLGKLRISPVIRYGSSAPFNLSSGGVDRNLDDLSNDRPNFTGGADIPWRIYGSSFPAQLASQLSLAPLGSPGTLPRNAGKGPALWQFNINVTREFKLTERLRMRPSVEVTNPLNLRVFSYGSNFINFDNLSLCTTGGTLTTAQQATCDGFVAPTRTMTHRRMRVGLRFDF
ncbi:MAG: TonB-dependent receptor [Pyrinomonadaceae bacterium]